VGLSLAEVQDWDGRSPFIPDDLDGLAGKWQLIMASGNQGKVKCELRRHDGEYRWFLFRREPIVRRRRQHHQMVWNGISI
jgi:hypothetical protein